MSGEASARSMDARSSNHSSETVPSETAVTTRRAGPTSA